MAVRHMRVAAAIVGVVALGVLLTVGLVAHDWWTYPTTPIRGATQETEVVIRRGMNFPQILTALTQARAVARPSHFRLYANLSGRAHRIRAGRYTLAPGLTPKQLLDLLVKGVREKQVRVTIPEGKHVLDVAEILDAAGVAPFDDLVAAVRDPDFARRLGIEASSLEGYLFPDTYLFRPHTEAREALRVLVKRHRAVFAAIRAAHPAGARSLHRKYKLSDHQIVTLASIVERETGQGHERPRVASVYLNRLILPGFRPRLLQADPTIIYGCTVALVRSAACAKFEDRIRTIHLRDRDNPYNTYTHEGLPPGPIANPGRAALEAVFAPEQTSYLFFVSRNDGTHVFARTRAEHNANVRRYQQGPRPPRPAPAPSP